jgi:hypothetical protein
MYTYEEWASKSASSERERNDRYLENALLIRGDNTEYEKDVGALDHNHQF